MDHIPRLLKAFVIGGGVLLIVGMVTLVVLLAQRAGAPGDGTGDDAGPVAAPAIALPKGMTVEQMALDGRRLVLLGSDRAGRQQLIVVDPQTGARLGVLELRPEE